MTLLLCVQSTITAADTSFWVWHRPTDLSPKEREQLTQGHCHTLYWHVGMVAVKDNAWTGSGEWLAPERSPSTPELRCVPVLRGIIGGLRALPTDHAGLLRLLERARDRWGSDEVQLDFDCPDRLLADYAAQLAQCRDALKPTRLTITALAGWAARPTFAELSRSVDELFPMFYDLEPDTAANAKLGRYESLLDEAVFTRHLKAWKACPTPWHAGLPSFARISLFDPDGRSRGHLREWTWDEVVFHGGLRNVAISGAGLHALEVTQDTSLHEVPLKQGQRLVVREVDPAVASRCAQLASDAGAKSIVWFRLPAQSAASGWSLTQTLSAQSSPPQLTLTFEGEALELRNIGTQDLPPRFTNEPDQQRGWQIEIEAEDQRPVFREVLAGDFAQVTHTTKIAEATRVTLWFADLRSLASRRTHLFQLAPGTRVSSLRWRCVGDTATVPWQPLSSR